MISCISTLGCPELDLKGAAELARRHELRWLELRALSNTIELPALFKKQFGHPGRLAEYIRDLGIGICSLDTSFHLIGEPRNGRDELLSAVEWAAQIGVPWVRVFDGGRSGASMKELVGEALDTHEWWQDIRRRNWPAVNLLVETHDSFFTANALAALLSAVPGIVLLWDTHHTWRLGRESPGDTWAVVRGHVAHLHVKDSVPPLSPDSSADHAYVLPGTGAFPMQSLREQLEKDHFGGVISLEWERMWHPRLPPLEQALSSAKRHGW